VLIEKDNVAWEAELVMQHRATNTDKFYNIQICAVTNASKATQFVFFQQWGRTGTKGQTRTTEFASSTAAKAAFESKFEEKSGGQWSEVETGRQQRHVGKYQLLAKSCSVAAGGVQWQYHLTRDPRGKPDGWYCYDGKSDVADTATANMELYHRQWKQNNFLDIRFVASGDQGFTYKVDFNTMTQTNTTSNKSRPIRRHVPK
jgi:predicted DNA-binding WGR domain protein